MKRDGRGGGADPWRPMRTVDPGAITAFPSDGAQTTQTLITFDDLVFCRNPLLAQLRVNMSISAASVINVSEKEKWVKSSLNL